MLDDWLRVLGRPLKLGARISTWNNPFGHVFTRLRWSNGLFDGRLPGFHRFFRLRVRSLVGKDLFFDFAWRAFVIATAGRFLRGGWFGLLVGGS